MDCLYISHTGMTEPLGRSQVLGYLLGLARRGFEIEILSHEPAGVSRDALDETRAIIERGGMVWNPQVRSSSHHLGVKVWESGRAALVGLASALRRRPRIIHARSYLPAAVADVIATIVPRSKMIFDLRGMLGEEYLDAGHWTPDRLEYRLLKRFERHALARAEGVVVLTEALRRWLRDQGMVAADKPVDVIPCCVELERFQADEGARRRARDDLGVADRLVLVYSGSLGSWYQAQEMARFAGALKKLRPDLAWVVYSHADTRELVSAARAAGIDDVIVRPASPHEMPSLLPAGDIGVSFILPCFSKMGSSPTKVAEYLAAGMAAVVNAGVGDQGELRKHGDACVVAESYDDSELTRVAAAAISIAERPYADRAVASRQVVRARFSLADLGVPRYAALYERLISG